jgi:endo-1,4-beta-xylanase
METADQHSHLNIVGEEIGAIFRFCAHTSLSVLVCLLLSANSASGQDHYSWHDFKLEHKEFVQEHAAEIKAAQDEFRENYHFFLKGELIDGLGWHFKDNFHLARFKIKRVEPERDYPLNWLSLYNRYRIELTKKPRQYSDVELIRTIDKDLGQAAKVNLYFWGSSPTSNEIRFVYRQTDAPHNIVWKKTIRLGTSDKSYEFDEAIPSGRAGEYTLACQLGGNVGVVELTHFSMRDTADGKLRGPFIKQQIEDRVRIMRIWGKFEDVSQGKSGARQTESLELGESVAARLISCRQASLAILIQNKSGQPVNGARVEVSQLRHSFLFGCNLDGLRLDDHSALQRNYQQRFCELFNYAKIPCYWNAIEPAPGKRDFSKVDAMAKWCIAHNITANAYGLVSPFHVPDWAPKDFHLAVSQLRATVIETVKHLKNLVQSFDVLDGMSFAKLLPESSPIARWFRQDQEAGVAERTLLWAQTAGEGKVTLLINEQGKNFYSFLKQRNALPDAIGVILPMQTQVLPISTFEKFDDELNEIDKSIHVTDIAVVSAEPRKDANYMKTYKDWPSTKDGEADQADYVVKLYTALFSNPRITSISWHDLSDHAAWMGAPGGLLRRDGTPKPAYNRLMDLIHKQWWTKASGLSNEMGIFSTPAFFGNYKVTVSDGKGRMVRSMLTFSPATLLEPRKIIIGN